MLRSRFSDHLFFWTVAFCLALGVQVYLYTVFRGVLGEWGILGHSWWIVPFVFLCMLGYVASWVSRRLHAVRSTRLLRALDRTGGVWNYFTLFLAITHLLLSILDYFSLVATSPPYRLAIAFIVALATAAYGVTSALFVRTRHFAFPTFKLPPGKRIRIAQVSDVHLGPFIGSHHLARILKEVRAAAPDMLVVTGDLADGDLSQFALEARMLRMVRPPLGAFAVTGNHEYYSGILEGVAFMERSGLRVLRGEAVESGGILVAGVDDPDHLAISKDGRTRSEKFLDSLAPSEGQFVLLLRHRPVMEKNSLGKIDLQLSGHTHGGQIVPLPSSKHHVGANPRGIAHFPEGGALYVSTGAGFVGPPMRLMAPSEIAVIDLLGPALPKVSKPKKSRKNGSKK